MQAPKAGKYELQGQKEEKLLTSEIPGRSIVSWLRGETCLECETIVDSHQQEHQQSVVGVGSCKILNICIATSREFHNDMGRGSISEFCQSTLNVVTQCYSCPAKSHDVNMSAHWLHLTLQPELVPKGPIPAKNCNRTFIRCIYLHKCYNGTQVSE
jgi:hypothetical protein